MIKAVLYLILAFFAFLLLVLGLSVVFQPSAEDITSESAEIELPPPRMPSPESENPVQRLLREERSRLEVIDRRCRETSDQLARMAVRGREFVLRDGGPDLTPAEFLEQMDDATVGLSDFDCTQMIATLIVLIIQSR